LGPSGGSVIWALLGKRALLGYLGGGYVTGRGRPRTPHRHLPFSCRTKTRRGEWGDSGPLFTRVFGNSPIRPWGYLWVGLIGSSNLNSDRCLLSGKRRLKSPDEMRGDGAGLYVWLSMWFVRRNMSGKHGCNPPPFPQ